MKFSSARIPPEVATYEVQQCAHTARSSYVWNSAAVAGVDDSPALSYRKGSDWLGANDLFSAMPVTGTPHWRYALSVSKDISRCEQNIYCRIRQPPPFLAWTMLTTRRAKWLWTVIQYYRTTRLWFFCFTLSFVVRF